MGIHQHYTQPEQDLKHMKEGIVSKEDCVELHAAYGKRLRNAEESIRAIQKEMDSELEKAYNANTWLD